MNSHLNYFLVFKKITCNNFEDCYVYTWVLY